MQSKTRTVFYVIFGWSLFLMFLFLPRSIPMYRQSGKQGR
jgi:hypothetical protein